ncbi:MAG: hypothetical protein N2645_13810 [Clostridia bacterium]|nr:hypothetical protein [Clostridia bacterium]
MKKYVLILLFAFSVVMFTGCARQSENSKVQDVSVNQQMENGASSGSKAEENSEDLPTIEPIISPAGETQNSSGDVKEDTTSDQAQNNSLLVNEGIDKAKIYLGMGKEDVKAVLKSMNIEENGETEITSDPNAWDWGNKVLDAGYFTFMFDKDSKLYDINIFGEAPTALGLKLEDPLEKMETLYGKAYKKYQTDNATIYEYMIGDHYFRVGIEAGKVANWGVAKFKFDK